MNWMKHVTLQVFLGSLVSALTIATASAQAHATADKPADVGVFLGYTSLATDYNPGHQPGFIGGLDYTRFFKHSYLVPSLELRASYSPVESTVGETVYSGGIKLEHAYSSRIHPYVDLLIGAGTVDFDYPPEFSDNSIVYTYGGGVDVDLIRHFSAKVDIQGSHWHLGNEDTRQPTLVSVGFVYHLHFRDRFRQ